MMAGGQFKHIALLCYLSMSSLLCVSAQCRGHKLITKQMNVRTKILDVTLTKVLDLVKDIHEERNTCTASLANMTRALNNLTNNIECGTDERQQHDIDLTGDASATCPRISVKVPVSLEKCLANLDTDLITDESARIWCLRVELWQYKRHLSDDYGDEDNAELLQVEEPGVDDGASIRRKRGGRRLRRRIAPRDMTQPPSGFRVRQEYRTLSRNARNRYHNALNVLYEDGTIDCFTMVHRNALRRGGAHRGDAFLAWHRAFITLFEEALRQVDDRVSLPYWDSSIDDNMAAGPGLSIMWDDDHLGEGNGLVNNGPFAGWVTRSNPLTRDIARGVGNLVRQSRIDFLMTFCRHADLRGRLENSHNGVHRWIGGTMQGSFAASDPVFYMHHAFVDYLWEKFREGQINGCGIDPAFDYPPTNNEDHDADETMDGMRFLRNIDGIAEYWTQNWFRYADTPTCDNNCGDSPDMFCDLYLNLCVSEMRFDVSGDLNVERKKRQTEDKLVESSDSKLYRGTCRTNPYSDECALPPPPETDEQYVEAVIRREVRMPADIQAIHDAVNRQIKYAGEFPPESGEVVFHGSPEEPGDCRTYETCVYDLLNAIVKKKKVTNKEYTRK